MTKTVAVAVNRVWRNYGVHEIGDPGCGGKSRLAGIRDGGKSRYYCIMLPFCIMLYLNLICFLSVLFWVLRIWCFDNIRNKSDMIQSFSILEKTLKNVTF